jgi:hypothetical protein
MTRAHAIVDTLLEMDDPDYVKSEVERLEPIHRIRISYSKFKFDEDGSGNYEDEHGWIDEDGEEMEPDEFDEEAGTTAVAKAIHYLRDNGATQPSNSSFWLDTWYGDETDVDHATGWNTERHYHLVGFTPEEQEAVFKGVTQR